MKKPTLEEWIKFKEKENQIIKKAMLEGKIRPYDQELIDDMSKYYYNGFPLSISLLCNSICRGKCNDMALELARVFIGRDERVGYFSFIVNGLKLNPAFYEEDNPDYAQHGVLVVIKKDGSAWVYDTNLQYCMDLDLYIEIERPLEIGELTRDNLKNYLEKRIANDPDSYILNKEAAMAIIPIVEECYMLPREKDYINSYAGKYNNGALRAEIEILKRNIGYRRELKKQRKEKVKN